MSIEIKETKQLPLHQVVALYRSNKWSAGDKPQKLEKALQKVDTLITAWDGERLVGLGSALTDGYLVVYYPHLLVHPSYQGKGIGSSIMQRMQKYYAGFHQQILVAQIGAVSFYEKCGFEKADMTIPMWIYSGDDVQ